MKNKKIKIFIILLIIIISLITIVIMFFNYSNNTLDKLGYNPLEIKEIEKLTKDEINTILKYDYNNNLIYILKSENYDSNKLDLYMKYTSKYKDIDYLKIFELINNKDFKNNKINDYIELLKKYNNVKEIINYVNNYSSEIIEINDITLSIINEKYFIKDYLDRYLTYYKKNNSLTTSEIIKRVNSNLDYTFYIDAKSSDISKGIYTLVNKFYYLEETFIPEDIVTADIEYTVYNGKLNKTAYENFVKMADAAKESGLTLKITTGYRDYNFQSALYNNYVKIDGVENADTYSARPGFSEHQLGYSIDLTNANNVDFEEFEYTEEYKWLNDNAHKYGFIMRYPKDKEYITGYMFESWHYRYVGVDIATYIYENNITYEEYYAYFLR